MVNSENIYVKEVKNARTYKEGENWYMELVFVNESGCTYIIPKVGPIISDDEYITIKDLFEETYSRHMVHHQMACEYYKMLMIFLWFHISIV